MTVECSGAATAFCLGSFAYTKIHDLIERFPQVFEQVRRDRPGVMAKIIPVAGDVTMDALGLSQSDLDQLCENVSVVFNSAATVRFDEDLRTAVEMNVKGPLRLIGICRKMKHLEVCAPFISIA